jgi:hypothetical protein
MNGSQQLKRGQIAPFRSLCSSPYLMGLKDASLLDCYFQNPKQAVPVMNDGFHKSAPRLFTAAEFAWL